METLTIILIGLFLIPVILFWVIIASAFIIGTANYLERKNEESIKTAKTDK